MSVFNLNSLPKQNRIRLIAEFYDTINSLKDRNEVRLFFKDLLFPNEIAMLMRRLEVAVLLESGATYYEIIKSLGVGRTKIANIHKILSIEGNGYKLSIERLIEDRKRRIKEDENKNIDPLSFKGIAKRDPNYFRLIGLIDDLIKSKNDPEMKKRAAFFTPSFDPSKKNK